MDKRIYFVVGDVLVNVAIALLVALVSYWLVSTNWNMLLAMWLMMFVGMVVAMLFALPAGILFGAMEVMLPMKLSGMLSGMVVGMWAAMQPITLAQAIGAGGTVGLISIVSVWFLNSRVRGIQTLAEN